MLFLFLVFHYLKFKHEFPAHLNFHLVHCLQPMAHCFTIDAHRIGIISNLIAGSNALPIYLKMAPLINSLWPGDAIWRQRSGSTLAQVMAWCHQATSHYLSQCWLIIGKVKWDSSDSNFTRDHLKFHSNFPGANELTSWPHLRGWGWGVCVVWGVGVGGGGGQWTGVLKCNRYSGFLEKLIPSVDK